MDNTSLNPGANGSVVRDIDKGGLHTQVVVLDLGGSGAENLATDRIPVALQARKTDGTFDYPLMDRTSHELGIIHHQHRMVHSGVTFRYSDAVTLGSGTSQDYLITTPNSTMWSHFNFEVDGTAVTTLNIYEGSDKTGTTLQTLWNANRNSATTATTTVHKGTSGGTTDGTLMVNYSSGTATNQSRSPASLESSEEWVLKQNTKYILRITSGTAGNLCNVYLSWYELVSLG